MNRFLTAALACTLALFGCADDSDHGDAGDVAADSAADGDASVGDADADAIADTGPPFDRPNPVDLVRYVDPFIGTDGPGNVIPGALVPHGVVRASPVTNTGDGSIDAYEDGDGQFFGYAHMHLEGPGGSANGYGHIVLRPFPGAVGDAPAAEPLVLDPSLEDAEPGWYALAFADGTQTEVTATQWAAMHRYAFGDDVPAGVILDLSESRGRSVGGTLERVAPGEFRGSGRYQVHPAVSEIAGDRATGRIEVYWALTFDPAPDTWGTWGSDEVVGQEDRTGRNLGLAVGWDDPGVEVTVRVGLSLVDSGTAAEHRDELATTFVDARALSSDAWNERLNRIRAESTDETMLTEFYTALYHAMFQPADYTEGDRFVSAWAGEPTVHDVADGRRYVTDDWCLWDTYRTSHPLRTLVEPDLVDDIVWSSLQAHTEGGWLPKCPWAAGGYSRVMTGNPQVAIIADAVVKGFRGFDTDLAMTAVRHTSEEDDNPFPNGLCGYFGLGTPPEYVSDGFVSRECDATQGASTTLEIAYADWTVARMAETLGDAELAATYDGRASSWRNHWDADVGFMRGRHRNGDWVEPFDPASTADNNDFVEASSWIFSFFVPHDIPALIEVFGGEETFVERLETFFDDGHFDPSNQPSFHIPYLYAHAGRADLTQAQVRSIVETRYGTGRNGLPGNDDAGSTSAWLALASMGLYPMAPGDTTYTIGSPTLDRVELLLDPGHQADASFVIEAQGASAGARFVQSATLNGAALDVPFIDHATIVSGGSLELVMGDEPSSWGSSL